MLYFVILASRARKRLRTMYWLRARSVWRIERRRLRLGLWVFAVVGRVVSDDAARSSIVSICRCRIVLEIVLGSIGM
jgi:hypothetical protein